MTAIETDHLTKRFGDVTAIEDVSLSVRQGEVFGLLGPNGAGKSTLLNVLLDLVRPTSGSVTVLGYDPRTDAAEVRRRTGVVPEGAGLYERLTGREHLDWIARATDSAVDVDRVLGRVGLAAADADRRVGGYSKGMRQRLALGMALAGDPELLILDEPSAGLDPSGMRDFREIVLAEAAEGRTVLLSSHHLNEVEAVCDRIGIVADGRLVATGTPAALAARHDLGGSIEFEVARVPDRIDLTDIDGVESVAVEGSTVAVAVRTPEAKIEAATRLAGRTRVLDVVSEDAPLERLFDTYTTSERRNRAAAETEADTGAGGEPRPAGVGR